MKTIFKIVSGSFLYGTNTETSDRDYVGVFMPELNDILGLYYQEEIQNNIVDKNEMNKNTVNAVDDKLYNIKKFIQLSSQCNPNIIEMFFAPQQSIIEKDPIMDIILNNFSEFITLKLIPTFFGYANSQKHKMVIKTENFTELSNAVKILTDQSPNKFLFEIANELQLPSKGSLIEIGDLKFPITNTVKKTLNSLNERLKTVSHRTDLILKYGYDTKFGSHLIRLLYEAIDLLTYGKLIFPLKNANEIRDIKLGKFSCSDIISMSETLEHQINDLKNKSNLPLEPDMKKINLMLIDSIKSFYNI